MKVKSLSCVRLFATPCTLDYQAPLSMGFSRQVYRSGLPFPSPGDLSNPGIESRSYTLQTVQFSSVSQPCLTLCSLMNCRTPGLPVHLQLLGSTQTHVHRVGDAIQHLILCHSLPLLSSVFPSIRVFSNESALHIR